MYVFSNCRNEFLLIINVYAENNPTVRGLKRNCGFNCLYSLVGSILRDYYIQLPCGLQIRYMHPFEFYNSRRILECYGANLGEVLALSWLIMSNLWLDSEHSTQSAM